MWLWCGRRVDENFFHRVDFAPQQPIATSCRLLFIASALSYSLKKDSLMNISSHGDEDACSRASWPGGLINELKSPGKTAAAGSAVG